MGILMVGIGVIAIFGGVSWGVIFRVFRSSNGAAAHDTRDIVRIRPKKNQKIGERPYHSHYNSVSIVESRDGLLILNILDDCNQCPFRTRALGIIHTT